MTDTTAAHAGDAFTIRALSAEGDTGAWDAYVQASPQGRQCHLSAWRTAIRRAAGHDSVYLEAVRPDGTLCGLLPLVRQKSKLFGDALLSMPYLNYGGAIADSPAVETALMDAAGERAKALGCASVEFRDAKPREEGWPTKSTKVAMLLDLPDDPAVLQKRLGAKRRSQIRRPLKEGPEVHKGGRELLPLFYPVFAETMRDLGTPVYSRHFFEAICATFPKDVAVVAITLKGKPVAAAFLIGFKDTLEIPWAGTLREVNPISMNMLLYWEVICLAIERGYRRFDFGRSTRDSGTYHFKRRWGAEPQPLHWHYWLAPGETLPQLNPDNAKFRLAIRAWQTLPLPLANALGPPIARNLP